MKERNFIPALTGIRAICAYGIFFYHINIFSKEAHPSLYTVVDQFYSFIPFFFVISGFVIFYTYYSQEKFTKKEVYNYFIGRLARIFPILLILNSIGFLLAYREHLFSLFDTIKLYLLNITLIKGFSSDFFLTGIAPSWTNTVEEMFYLLTPVIFILVRKSFFLVKFTLVFYILGFLVTLLFIRFPAWGFFSSFKFTAYCTFFGRVFEFVCGMYLAMLFKKLRTNKLLEKFGKFTMAWGFILVLVAFALQYHIAISNNVPHANETWPGIIVNNFLFPVAIFLILYNLLYYKTIIRSFLSSAIMVSLGNSTYSFYLLHTTFVLSYIYKFISTNVFITFIVMIIVAFIFHKTVEQPLAVYLRRKLSRKT